MFAEGLALALEDQAAEGALKRRGRQQEPKITATIKRLNEKCEAHFQHGLADSLEAYNDGWKHGVKNRCRFTTQAPTNSSIISFGPHTCSTPRLGGDSYPVTEVHHCCESFPEPAVLLAP
ncbi:hypothetical protein OPQ81_003358 [Rhizoctonia solani]|nr:hypothetical protein OPQ81_003358 [Rhizoctonia solani]